MRGIGFISDKGLLLRQAIAGWLILFVGVFLFVLIGLLLSPALGSQQQVILVSFGLVAPLIILAHYILYRRGYHIRKLTNTPITAPAIVLNPVDNPDTPKKQDPDKWGFTSGEHDYYLDFAKYYWVPQKMTEQRSPYQTHAEFDKALLSALTNRFTLWWLISTMFDRRDVRNLCTSLLDVNFRNLPVQPKADIAFALVDLCAKQNRISDLALACHYAASSLWYKGLDSEKSHAAQEHNELFKRLLDETKIIGDDVQAEQA